MALRGRRCLLDRRFADRGNDRSMFVSCARGEDRHAVRRTADRGNDRVDSNPRDLKIKRLRQRVRDLEEIQRLRQRVRDLKEIKRIRQRVQDLELQRDRRIKETESGRVVRNDVNEEEEHPFGHSHTRFHEPIYQECLSKDEPRFDEDGIIPDEEECMFVHQVLNGVTIHVNKQVKDEDGGATVPTVATGCASVVKSDHALPLDHTTISLVSLKALNIADRMKSSPKKVEKLSNPLTSREIVNLEIILEGST
ncbi:hypothetical protein HanOQP8_Chr09g0325031 [Helianthus annuus]|nr:hypothetical protein HanOQP8_Chr09g0325031 [Helianthus annuus]